MFQSVGQSQSFRGLGADFGSLGQVVSGAATRGAIVDVVIEVGDAGRVFFYDARLAQALRDRLNNSGFKVLALDASNLGNFGGGGTIRARVQILTDGYGSAADAASVVAGAASYLGYNATGSTGVLVSGAGTVTGGASGDTTGQVYTNPNADTGANPVSTLVESLTASPVSLAVIVGAGALLLLTVLKK